MKLNSIKEISIRWTDNHCHLTRENAAHEIAEAQKAGVSRLIVIGTDLDSSKEAIEIAAENENVFATAGVHPHDSKNGTAGIEELLNQPETKAVGECGLDYFYNHSEAQTQKGVFAEHIAFAKSKNLPLVIHTRDAWDDTFDILRNEDLPETIIFHCFTGGPTEIKRALSMGGYVSFSGILTFKKAEELREAAELCPMEKILLETDSPFLSPEPVRGKENSPANLPIIGSKMAEIKNTPFSELAEMVWQNTSLAYGLP